MTDPGLSRYQLPSEDEGDFHNRLFRIQLKQIDMEGKLDRIVSSIEKRAEEEKADRFTHKDFVNFGIATVVAAATLFGGLFWIIQTQVNPISASFETEKHAITDRFTVLSDSIRQIRDIESKRNDDIMKFMADQHKEVVELQLRMQKEEDRH